ncbi:MAG: flagellar export chaperone FliS [Polaromonas sp.]|jgi:flagellar protein FliS
MYLTTQARALNAYRQVGVAAQVDAASGPQLVSLLFEALRVQLLRAETALARNQLSEKGEAIGKAVRIIEEGLRAGLDLRGANKLPQMLDELYGYCGKTLTEANFYNDAKKVSEVARLIETVVHAWKQAASGSTAQQEFAQ